MGFLDFCMVETYVSGMQGDFKLGIASCLRRESLEIPFVIAALSCLRIFCMLNRHLLLIIDILPGKKDLKFDGFLQVGRCFGLDDDVLRFFYIGADLEFNFFYAFALSDEMNGILVGNNVPFQFFRVSKERRFSC